MTSKKEKTMTEEHNQKSTGVFVRVIFLLLGLLVVIPLTIRIFLYEPFYIPSSAMSPTLEVGNYVLAEKFAYGYGQYSFPFGFAPIKNRISPQAPQRGDIVVFWNAKTQQNYIERLIGLPGETIQYKRGRLFINGKMVDREYVSTKEMNRGPILGAVQTTEYIELLPDGVQHAIYEETNIGKLDNTEIYTVPKGHYFMMGDNRDNSMDSRVITSVGFIPFEHFIGRVNDAVLKIEEW